MQTTGIVYIELVNEPRASLFDLLNLSMRLLVHSLNYYKMMKGLNKNLKPQKGYKKRKLLCRSIKLQFRHAIFYIIKIKSAEAGKNFFCK